MYPPVQRHPPDNPTTDSGALLILISLLFCVCRRRRRFSWPGIGNGDHRWQVLMHVFRYGSEHGGIFGAVLFLRFGESRVSQFTNSPTRLCEMKPHANLAGFYAMPQIDCAKFATLATNSGTNKEQIVWGTRPKPVKNSADDFHGGYLGQSNCAHTATTQA